MNPTFRVHGAYVSLASLLSLGIVATTHGCTTEINNAPDAGGSSSSSSSGGSSSSGSSSGGSSSSSSSSSSGGTISCPPPGATTIVVDAGLAPIPPANSHPQGDASPPWNVQWGTFSPFGAGTYWYPADSTGAPAPPGSIADLISDASSTCTTLGSQNTFSATYSLPTNSFHLTGTIGTYSGVGIYLVPCFDGSSFSGVQFTVQGDVGDEQVSDAGDGGSTGGLMQLVVAQASNNMINTTGTAGTCAAGCNPAATNFPVTSTPQTFTIHWTDLAGGTPTPTLDTPTQIVRIGWQYIWPCLINPTPFQTNVTISNIQLVQ
ncbi:MAG TPA: hypothetical protein VGM06_21040 [Polyangiaceae bacterium]